MDTKTILIAFGFGITSFLAGYYVSKRRAKGLYKQAEELCDWAGKVLEEVSEKLKDEQ